MSVRTKLLTVVLGAMFVWCYTQQSKPVQVAVPVPVRVQVPVPVPVPIPVPVPVPGAPAIPAIPVAPVVVASTPAVAASVPESPPTNFAKVRGVELSPPTAKPVPSIVSPSSLTMPLKGNYHNNIYITPLSDSVIMVTDIGSEWSPAFLNVNPDQSVEFRPNTHACYNGYSGRLTPNGIHFRWAMKPGIRRWFNYNEFTWSRIDNSDVLRPRPGELSDEQFAAEVERHNVTPEQLESIKEFGRALKAGNCESPETNAEWTNIMSTLTPSEKQTYNTTRKLTYTSSDTSVAIPCPDIAKESWILGDNYFRPLPFWSHCCNKGPALIQCPTREIFDPNHQARSVPNAVALALQGRITASALPICQTFIENFRDIPKPIVYGVGIGGEWDFEDNVATLLNAEVHGFDPTDNLRASHARHRHPGVHFHFKGLRGESHAIHRATSYGHVGGPLFHLQELMDQLGHKEIHMLRVDCEGCEWEAFDWIQRHPETIAKVKVLIWEVHLSHHFGMRGTPDAKLLANFWEGHKRLGFKLYFHHDNPCTDTHTFLRKLGFDGRVCAHEIAFFRET
eukprot:TRINITY_DN5059_c0_g1_i4.p1 TRINITY_DN5059_c0_g1~~TRINITY_DN5059_c0_g1_i4.p1  ORF type:complete len:564 (+),score=126.42 TRINITY_DN5059_c0_g1_i4:44-1735(+)